MTDIDFTIITALVVLAFLFLLAYRKVGSKFFVHLKDNGSLMGILLAFISAVMAILVVSAFYSEAEASEINWFQQTTVFAGVDAEVKNKVFCHRGDINDKLVSNIGIKQKIMSIDRFSLSAKYTHHSCALNKDKPTYDAVGLSVEWTFKR